MSSISNRIYARIVVAIALGAFATGIALAQQPTSTWQQIKQRGELRIGVTPGEPWYFKDPATGQWSGIGYRMGQQIAKDLGVKLVPVETTWGNSVAAIQANQIDVMFVLDATDERKKAVDFPDAPFFWYAQGVLAREGLPASNWADLDRDNVKIAVTLGTAPDRDLTKRLTKAKIERFQNMDEAIAAFYSGRVDATASRGARHQRRHPARRRQDLSRLPRQGIRQVLQERRDAEVLRGIPRVPEHRREEGTADHQGAMEVGERKARRGLRRVSRRSGSSS